MPRDLTLLLDAVAKGTHSPDELLHEVYQELRLLAAKQLAGERAGHTLQATALVHEAYLRLLGPAAHTIKWENRAHFFGAAAEAMRRVLVDHARAKAALKRGGPEAKRSLSDFSLDTIPAAATEHPELFLDLHQALTALEFHDAAKAQLVRLRIFAGLTLEQIAELQQISPATADRHWAYAKAWLFQALTDADRD